MVAAFARLMKTELLDRISKIIVLEMENYGEEQHLDLSSLQIVESEVLSYQTSFENDPQ
jgi:hypothetical protein